MDFERISLLPKFGFCGGIRIAELQVACDSVAADRGVYLVVRKSTRPVRFLKKSPGGHFKSKDPSVSVAVLNERWLDRPKVVYIGKAGGAIQDRLRSFMHFGLGHRCAHWGGRYIWQLADAKELVVYWKATPNQEPREVEKALLTEYFQAYNRLPFANLRR